MSTQIKGMAVAGTVKRIKEVYGEEVFSAVLAELSEEERKIMGGNILPSLWYSLDAFTTFLKAEVKVIYKGDKTKLRKGSEEVVSNQLKGIYRFFVKLGSPGFVVGRIGSVHNSYFRGIELEKEISDGKFMGRYYGYKPDQDVLEDVIMGFYLKALEISGAKNIKAKFDIPIKEGKEFSQILVTWE